MTRHFPLGAAVSVADLSGDPLPVLAALRAAEPVSWLPVLGGWLVTRHDLAGQVLRDARTFTVDDPRFATARVTGPSMLSLDGPEHRRHREAFSRAFRAPAVAGRLAGMVAGQVARLTAGMASAGAAELRRDLAGPLAAAVMADLLGLDVPAAEVLAWYDAIVAEVSALSGSAQPGSVQPGAAVSGAPLPDGPGAGGAAFAALQDAVAAAAARGGGTLLAVTAAAGDLSRAELAANAAVLMFGGIETVEGMIGNAAWHLLRQPSQAAAAAADEAQMAAAVEESLRLEPAAALLDRYATADTRLGGAQIRRGERVTISVIAANTDPARWPDPEVFRPERYLPAETQAAGMRAAGPRGPVRSAPAHLAFAVGPHFCIGAALARLEAQAALTAVLAWPQLRLDPRCPGRPAGLVFRKPAELHLCWNSAR